MTAKRQITIKPSCAQEILAFPGDRAGVLWEKINHLIEDPVPDGKVKVRLKGADGICRLRVGDHRVFYRFGDQHVSLLGIRRRREDTYVDVPDSDAPPAPEDDVDLEAVLGAHEPQGFVFQQADEASPLPVTITAELLSGLGIPPGHALRLLDCRTEEQLLDAQVPQEMLSRVVEAIYPPSLRQVESQPDLVVPSPEDLVRYKEGDLLAFLLRLDEEQEKLTRWALSGPTMVRGGAGTGKSTVALYRVKAVLERPGATGAETVLFTTYTNALCAVTRQLLEQMLTPEQFRRVEVSTCDQIARGIVARSRSVGSIESGVDATRRMRRLRETFEPPGVDPFQRKVRSRMLARLSDRYVLEEIEWIIDGRDLESLDAYLEAPRPGRGLAFNAGLRETIWELARAFRAAPTERFAAIRTEALQLVRNGESKGNWDYVFVDEAQDLSPTALALMAELCSTPEGLFFAADAKQSIYSRNYSWSSAHPRLQFKGRTAVLKRNYRSTVEIDRAAYAVLDAATGTAQEPSSSVHPGPLPILLTGTTPEGEPRWVARFIRQMSHHLHLPTSAAAVLVPTGSIGKEMATALGREGLEARYFAGRDLDLRAAVVKVVTLHSAKGLEFPIVAVGGLVPGTYPRRADFDDEELYLERLRHERRLLYVGLTRAMRGLLLAVPEGCEHEALVELDPAHWHREEASA